MRDERDGRQVSAQAGALPPMDHAGRRERLRRSLARANVGADGAPWLLVTEPHNVRYLTGFRGSNGQLLLGPDVDADRLITDGRYEERAAGEAPDLTLELSREPMPVALRHAEDHRLAVEAAHLTWAAADRLRDQAADHDVQVVPTTDLVERLREVKDDAELARLAQACRLTADVLTWLFDEVVAPGRSERELATALERRFIDQGADGVAFPSIVASGPNAAVPHHEPTTRVLQPGDLLTVDCGAVIDGYHADLTRTVAVGHLDDELTRVHDLVREAQAAGRAAAIDGAAASDVDAAAREVITRAGYGQRFVHGTGHGVGLQIHEAPFVAKTSTATLVAGTALTVEPGIYLPGRGGVRIEDTIVITAGGAPRILTDLPHDLRTV
jgi:Xaa-Pro aminopeptidase